MPKKNSMTQMSDVQPMGTPGSRSLCTSETMPNRKPARAVAAPSVDMTRRGSTV